MRPDFTYVHEKQFALPPKIDFLKHICERMGLTLEILQIRESSLVRVWENSDFVDLPINVFTVNSYTAAYAAKDKVYTYLILQRAGVRIPRGDYYFRSNYFGPSTPDFSIGRGKAEALRGALMLGMGWSPGQAEEYLLAVQTRPLEFNTPLIAKPNSLSHGKGVSKLSSFDELEEAVNRVFNLPTDFEHTLIIQEYIEGSEFRLVLLDGDPILCLEKANRRGDYSIDRTADLSPHFIEWGRLIAKEMHMRYLAIDFRCLSLDVSTNEAIVLEVNNNPGFPRFFQEDSNGGAIRAYERLLRIMLDENKRIRNAIDAAADHKL